MSDLENPQREIVPIVGELKKKQLTIEINEKLAAVENLKLRLKSLVNIEQKKIEFQIDVLEKQISFYQGQFIDVKVEKSKNKEEDK